MNFFVPDTSRDRSLREFYKTVSHLAHWGNIPPSESYNMYTYEFKQYYEQMWANKKEEVDAMQSK